MEQPLLEKVKVILGSAKDMTIATIRKDGFPQATTVSFVNDGLTIYFGCDSNAQKAANIALNNKVSLTVDLEYSDWNEIQGLSMGALAERITDPDELKNISKLMYDKFPQVVDFVPEEPESLAVFRITPKVVSILDYSKGFGHADLVEL